MNKMIVLGVTLILTVLLFIYMHTGKLNSLFTSPFPVYTISSRPKTTTFPLQTKVVSITIKNNRLIKGPKTLEIPKNQMIVLQITADTDDELSLLGYDKHVFLHKGKMVVLSFLSTLAGKFSYIMNNSKNILGTIEVKK